MTERQDFQDPILVSGAIGVGNLLATGLAWANNRAEIDNLRTRVEKLESLLKTTCNKVNIPLIIFSWGHKNVKHLRRFPLTIFKPLTNTFQVNDVGTAADFIGTESTNIAANTADGDTAQGAVLTRLAAVSNIGSCSL